MTQLVYAVCTRFWDGWRDVVHGWEAHAAISHPYILVPNMPIPLCFEQAYRGTSEPILAYIHDDLQINEFGWDERVMREFEDPGVGLVGFAGALGHGSPSMYQEEFRIPNLVRRGFRSNLKDAERHGGRCSRAIDVSVLDGMALFVRRSVLDAVGGWPLSSPVGYFMYAEWLSCETRRQGLRIRMAGVACKHLGGKSSGTPLPYTYEEEHKWFYEHNRDVMPAWVTR